MNIKNGLPIYVLSGAIVLSTLIYTTQSKSTDVGKEAEAGNYGLSCENGDLSAFIKYIDILSNDEGLRKKMGNNGYKKLKQDFNVDYSYELIMSHLPK